MEENDITMHVVAVTAIIKKGNRYLLARRSVNDPQQGGKWSFPGGKVDMEVEEQIIEKTLKREVLEEVGIEIEDKVEFINNNAFIRVSGHHVIMMDFLCIYKSGEAKALEDQEEVKWLTLEEMDGMMKELPNFTWVKIQRLKSLAQS